MPIASIPGDEAYRNLRRSRASLWPDERVGDQRLSGLAKIELKPSFGFSRADRILTLGSCFARRLENRLDERGFDVPMKQACLPGAGGQGVIDPDLLTKFTIQSIENELAWASGASAPPPDKLLLELADGLWHDPQLAPGGAALPLEKAVARRAEIQAAVAQFRNCRIVVLTLGLAEAWFDQETSLYLNAAPPTAAIRRYPGRFSLHILSHDDILASLERVHDILREHGRPDGKLLITVSPVPFKATFSGDDVIAANTYSKSVQRAACRALVARREGVDYFPSYEIVSMSPRQLAYESDNLHVSAAMVGHIMDQVLGAYSPDAVDEGETEPAQVEIAESRRGGALGGYFDGVVRAKHLIATEQHEEAGGVCEALLTRHRAEMTPRDLSAVRSMYAAALRGQGRWAESAAQLELAAAQDPRGGEVFYKLGQCRDALGELAAAVDAFRRAVALDSTQPSYRAHLDAAENRLRAARPLRRFYANLLQTFSKPRPPRGGARAPA